MRDPMIDDAADDTLTMTDPRTLPDEARKIATGIREAASSWTVAYTIEQLADRLAAAESRAQRHLDEQKEIVEYADSCEKRADAAEAELAAERGRWRALREWTETYPQNRQYAGGFTTAMNSLLWKMAELEKAEGVS